MPRTALVVFTLITLALSTATPARAATAFMYIDGVAGNSPTDKTHQNWIELTAFKVPVQSSQPPTLGGLGPILGDIEIGKKSDATSTALQDAVTNGTIFNIMKIDYCLNCQKGVQPGPSDILFVGEWTAELAEFVGLGFEGTTENLTITFGQIKYDYSKQDKDGNKSDGTHKAIWPDPAQPPNTSTEGSPTGPFMLFDEFIIPEPTTAMVLAVGWLVVLRRRGL